MSSIQDYPFFGKEQSNNGSGDEPLSYGYEDSESATITSSTSDDFGWDLTSQHADGTPLGHSFLMSQYPSGLNMIPSTSGHFSSEQSNPAPSYPVSFQESALTYDVTLTLAASPNTEESALWSQQSGAMGPRRDKCRTPRARKEKWHEKPPQSDPELEKKRQRALRNKQDRERRQEKEQSMVDYVYATAKEIENLRQEKRHLEERVSGLEFRLNTTAYSNSNDLYSFK